VIVLARQISRVEEIDSSQGNGRRTLRVTGPDPDSGEGDERRK
jgi:hypothetical protein